MSANNNEKSGPGVLGLLSSRLATRKFISSLILPAELRTFGDACYYISKHHGKEDQTGRQRIEQLVAAEQEEQRQASYINGSSSITGGAIPSATGSKKRRRGSCAGRERR